MNFGRTILICLGFTTLISWPVYGNHYGLWADRGVSGSDVYENMTLRLSLASQLSLGFT